MTVVFKGVMRFNNLELTSPEWLVLAQATALSTLLSYNFHLVAVSSGYVVTTVPSSVFAT